MTKRVVIVQELLPQYRVAFFDGLRAALAAEDVTLDLVHGSAAGDRAQRRDEASVPWATYVGNRRLALRRRELVWQPALSVVRDADLVITEQANRQLLNYVLLAGAATRRTPRLALWGHGANLQSRPQDRLSELVKRKTLTWAHWWFAYTAGSAQRVEQAGFPRERITVVQNSVDLSAYAGLDRSRKQPGRCVFVGSLHEHKRVDFLLDAADVLHEQYAEFELHVAGDGPLRQQMSAAASSRPWVIYHGSLFGRAKAELVTSSVLTLMPGLVGLAVLDAFAAQAPMVTADVPFHSPEFEYLTDGENGLVVRGDEGVTAYARAVGDLLAQPDRLAALAEGCRRSAQRYSLSQMVSRFGGGIRSAMAQANA
jgi:glycosyltransferase involved in cell wall biosynthesis